MIRKMTRDDRSEMRKGLTNARIALYSQVQGVLDDVGLADLAHEVAAISWRLHKIREEITRMEVEQ